jgi:hypothetical protein
VARLITDIRERPQEKKSGRQWGKLVFNWFVIEDGVASIEATPAEGSRTAVLQGRGKLKLGSTGPHFPFDLALRFTDSSGTIKVKGDIGSPTKLRVDAKKIDIALSTTTTIGFDALEITSAHGADAASSFVATLQARNARIHGTVFPYVHAVVRRSTGPYLLEGAQFEGLGGSITVNASYLPSLSTSSLKISWKTVGIEAQDLFHLAGSSVEARGTADSEGTLETMPGGEFFPKMNGEINLHVKDGWFGNVPGLFKILSRINLTTLLTEIKGEHRAHVPFDETHGTVTIENGKASTKEPFVLQNKTVEMAFMGTYDLTDKTVDGKIVINFLTVTDEIIQKIPGVRDILLGDGRGLIPIWVEVKGKAHDPKVRVLSGKSITSPVWNTVSHILHLPGKLFNKLRGK